MRAIRSIKGLQRRWDALNARMARLYRKPYVMEPALEAHLRKFEPLARISDRHDHYAEFQRLPSLEQELLIADRKFSAQQRTSLAQRDRARRCRSIVTSDGVSLDGVIRKILGNQPRAKRAKEYWEPFIDCLDARGLTPIVTASQDNAAGETVEYGQPGRRRQLGCRQFQNRISAIRRSFSRSN